MDIQIEVDGEAIPLDSLGPQRGTTDTLLAASKEEKDTSSLLLPPGASPAHSLASGKGKAKRLRASSRPSLLEAADVSGFLECLIVIIITVCFVAVQGSSLYCSSKEACE